MSGQERPEDRARIKIDGLLGEAGWLVQDRANVNIDAGRGIAIREFQFAPGYGFADYLLYVDGYAAGVVEAKKEGDTLTDIFIDS
jgi:type I restriction enzyme R subunit